MFFNYFNWPTDLTAAASVAAPEVEGIDSLAENFEL